MDLLTLFQWNAEVGRVLLCSPGWTQNSWACATLPGWTVSISPGLLRILPHSLPMKRLSTLVTDGVQVLPHGGGPFTQQKQTSNERVLVWFWLFPCLLAGAGSGTFKVTVGDHQLQAPV